TVRLAPEYLMRQPFELGCSPEASSRTPALCSSSWYLAISAKRGSQAGPIGMTSASESFVAFTMIMNRMVLSPLLCPGACLGAQHAGFRQLFVELPHRGQGPLVREDTRFGVFVGFHQDHESHCHLSSWLSSYTTSEGRRNRPLRFGEGGVITFPLSRRERGTGGEDRRERGSGVRTTRRQWLPRRQRAPPPQRPRRAAERPAARAS